MAARPGCDGGRLAQLVEQLTLNQRVVGSNPTAPTTLTSDCMTRFVWSLDTLKINEGFSEPPDERARAASTTSRANAEFLLRVSVD